MDHLNDRLVENLSSAPFHLVSLVGLVVVNLSIDPPKRLWHKLLNFFGLIDTETKSGRLAWPIGQHPYTRLMNLVGQGISLESRESHSNFEIKDLASIHRYSLVVVRLVLQPLKSSHNIFLGD